MTLPPNPKGELTFNPETGEAFLRCPGCGHWGAIDRDQLYGRVSVDHSGGPARGGCGCGCTFHETRNWAVTADRVARRS